MAKYQKYAEYKDSGEDWLGEIPVNWDLKKHKYIAIFSKGKNPDLLVDQYSSGLYPYLSMDSLRGKSESKYAEYKKGLVLVKDNQPLIIWDGSNSGEFVLGKKGILSSTMASASLVYEIDNKFYWYTCICIEPEMRKHATGMGIPHVNGDELRSISLPLPNLNEQEKIANFLDHETAKIDTLIAKQEKLIELLKEKRQAVISHAVTKGLNLNAPMKDSGVEWLGEVPEHWKIFNIQRILNFIEQGSSPVAQNQTPQDDEYGVLKISAVKKGKFFPNESKTLDYKSQLETKYIVHLGDLLVTRANTPQLVADACVVNTEPTSPTMMCDLIYRLNTISDIKKEFLCYWLLSNSGRTQIELDARGSSMTMAKVSQSHIKAWKVVLPPLKEQNDIVIYLDYKLKEIDRLIDKSMVTIKLIQERRTALISAAVTGKVDVRNWQNPNKNNNQDNMELIA
ncbi:restriction endonuclease subunit S [Acinetobacter junii]|uniref:restriction endonuclease subunit S n=1 Tax=Acinetobacter junii TaxID=40215 RepID=UPI001439B3A8|nr:restriction endonuclease subunit S [Acinetobacter junii]NKG33881.1 hypothetical protein [Acinetobacter junii]